MSQTYGAIDIGTNSVRMLVSDGQIQKRLTRVCGVGSGMRAKGAIQPDAIERTLGALAEYKQLVDQQNVSSSNLAIVGTEPVVPASPAPLAPSGLLGVGMG